MKCRHCGSVLSIKFVDLGYAPPSNSYLTSASLDSPELYYPLVVMLCSECFLLQTKDAVKAETFFNSDYAYLSSTSISWLEHSEKYVNNIIKQLHLDELSLVLEVACNDGYLLKNFVQKNIPCYGVEPSIGTAIHAKNLGIDVYNSFFTNYFANQLCEKNLKVDLVIGNNVYAHVPDINDFTKGIKTILKENGVVTLEFPWLKELIDKNQFDTIYHEHFSYLSLNVVNRIFNTWGLKIYKVEILPTHGGSLRVYGCHAEFSRELDTSVQEVLNMEHDFGLTSIERYLKFQIKVNQIKNNFLFFLLEQKKLRKKVVGYGAAAKGNTLINYAGIKNDLLEYICDASKSKQGLFTPGSHIPIKNPESINDDPPDYVVIFPWNISHEILQLNRKLIMSGVEFVSFIPDVKFYD